MERQQRGYNGEGPKLVYGKSHVGRGMMCHCMQLMDRLVGTFEENVEQWAVGADGAIQCRDVENLLGLGIGFFELIDDTCNRIRHASGNGPPQQLADAETAAILLKQETTALFARFLKPCALIESALRNLRNQGGDIDGAERFLGCLHEAENHVRRWEAEQTAAMKLRAQWLRESGMPDEEIREFCDPEKYPADLQQEQENVRAMAKLPALQPTAQQWERLVQRHAMRQQQ